MRPPVAKVLEKLGVVAKLRNRSFWTENCPLPSHGPPNPAHRWQNFFVRADDHPRKGQYHCFSCKAGGGLADLVAALLAIEREAAVDWLKALPEQPPELGAGVRVRYEEVGGRGYTLRLPAGVEQIPLARWNGVAREYARSRGIEDWQVERWRIGVAVEGRLEGRIVLPTYAADGRLLDYAARTYVGDPKRYLAASEAEHPVRGAVFGEQWWKPGFPLAVVFEGALNGLAVERALIGCGVGDCPICLAGLSGSDGADARRLTKLARFERLVLVTDPDRAGRAAADAIEYALRATARTARANIPAGMDAADLPAPHLRAELLRCMGGLAACSATT
jgi:hypothetical protein